MWIVELLVVLLFIWFGARMGSIGIGFAGGFFDQLNTEVLKRVVEFDVLGDGNTVFGDLGTSPTFIQNGVSASRA